VNSRHVRAYAALLRLYPRRFRDEYRREMVVLFAQQLMDARSSDGNVGVVRLWLRSLVDLIATAPGEHLEGDILVAQPVVGTDQPPAKPDRAERTVWVIAAMVPALIILFLYVLAPHFMDPMFAKPPEFMGIPAGWFVMGLSAVWYGIGVATVWAASRTAVRLVAFLLFIGPATFAFLLGPAIVLIAQNLGAQVGV